MRGIEALLNVNCYIGGVSKEPAIYVLQPYFLNNYLKIAQTVIPNKTFDL